MPHSEVKIDQGVLRGSVATNVQGGTFYSFQGIPYAKPPLGDLRFKAALAPEKWEGVLDATKEGDPCYHLDFYKECIVGSENCLILNVYTKEVSPKSSPVLFWVHGGGLIFGSSSTDLYGPEFLLTQDVVLVTINYRLGLLGFLSLEDPSLGVPGNAGLKDMIMALKWVQKNISRFGGDAGNVTVFGESAGGAAVHLLLLSPLSKGLFHKAIAQSGCVLNPWLPGRKGVDDIARTVGLPADEQVVYEYLMERSVEEIYNIQQKMGEEFFPRQHRMIGPVVEDGSLESRFLPSDPIDIMLSGNYCQVPLIMGYTTAEGMLFDIFKPPGYPLEPNFEDNVPWILGYQGDDAKCVADKLRKFYYGQEEPTKNNMAKKYEMVTDVTFLYGIYASVKLFLHVTKAPLYFYRMSAESGLNYFKNTYIGAHVPGVSHADDLGYLFKTFLTPEVQAGSREEIFLHRMVKLWANFAQFGNPTPEAVDGVHWNKLEGGKDLSVLDVGDTLVAKEIPEQGRLDFWEELFRNSPAGQRHTLPFKK